MNELASIVKEGRLALSRGLPTVLATVVAPVDPRIETAAIKKVFGSHAARLAVSSTKSMTGHALGAAGGIETGITALAIRKAEVRMA